MEKTQIGRKPRRLIAFGMLWEEQLNGDVSFFYSTCATAHLQVVLVVNKPELIASDVGVVTVRHLKIGTQHVT